VSFVLQNLQAKTTNPNTCLQIWWLLVRSLQVWWFQCILMLWKMLRALWFRLDRGVVKATNGLIVYKIVVNDLPHPRDFHDSDPPEEWIHVVIAIIRNSISKTIYCSSYTKTNKWVFQFSAVTQSFPSLTVGYWAWSIYERWVCGIIAHLERTTSFSISSKYYGTFQIICIYRWKSWWKSDGDWIVWCYILRKWFFNDRWG